MKRKPPAANACYPSGAKSALCYAGYALIALGALLLFLCVPGWAWLALIGLGLLAAGFLVIKLCGGGR